MISLSLFFRFPSLPLPDSNFGLNLVVRASRLSVGADRELSVPDPMHTPMPEFGRHKKALARASKFPDSTAAPPVARRPYRQRMAPVTVVTENISTCASCGPKGHCPSTRDDRCVRPAFRVEGQCVLSSIVKCKVRNLVPRIWAPVDRCAFTSRTANPPW